MLIVVQSSSYHGEYIAWYAKPLDSASGHKIIRTAANKWTPRRTLSPHAKPPSVPDVTLRRAVFKSIQSIQKNYRLVVSRMEYSLLIGIEAPAADISRSVFDDCLIPCWMKIDSTPNVLRKPYQ